MLPSMPVLFTKDSRDAFGNKIIPSTSFSTQSIAPKLPVPPEPPPETNSKEVPNFAAKEINTKSNQKQKEEPSKSKRNDLKEALVRSYYKKVQSRFVSSHMPKVPTNKFIQFQNILKAFDPTKETPIDLYKKVERIFGAENEDILEEFLLFLKPGQAAEIGRFMDHFMLVQMTSFIDSLKESFSRKPTVLRKMLRALSTGCSAGDVAAMKASVLPHLRSSPRLASTFKALFPDERPPNSLYEEHTDSVSEGFLSADCGRDVWELDPEPSERSRPRPSHHLDTAYLHGRIFLQHGKMLKPARVTFPYSKEPYRVHTRRLAPTNCHQTSNDSEEETSHKKKPKNQPKRTRKQAKSPTKAVNAVNDVNDNTKKECNSPRTVRNKNSKNKTNKKEIDILSCNTSSKKDDNASRSKKDRHDIKINLGEGPKSKQPRLGTQEVKTVVTENKGTTEEVRLIDETRSPGSKLLTLKTREAVKEDESKNIASHKNTNLNYKVQDRDTEIKVPVERYLVSDIKKKNSSWTREEDKTMLLVLKGEAGSEKVFGRIRELLPHRTVNEIKERFCHVMNLLQHMPVGEVT